MFYLGFHVFGPCNVLKLHVVILTKHVFGGGSHVASGWEFGLIDSTCWLGVTQLRGGRRNTTPPCVDVFCSGNGLLVNKVDVKCYRMDHFHFRDS